MIKVFQFLNFYGTIYLLRCGEDTNFAGLGPGNYLDE